MRTNIVRTINGELEHSDCDPKFIGEYLKRGWAVFDGEPPVKEEKIPFDPTDLSGATRPQLVGMAVEKGKTRQDAMKMKNPELIDFIKKL